MVVNNKELHKFLLGKGYHFLYHANSVQTSCTFIRNQGIMSRGAVEKHNLKQSPQTSDNIDKKYDVWDDIFLDVVDIHGYFPRQNLYGPVLFVYKVDVLLKEELPNVWITKDNPIYWQDDQDLPDKYFSTLDEYIKEFDYNVNNKKIQRKMITLRKTHKPLLFQSNLDKIILDNPKVQIDDKSLYNHAKSVLIEALESSNLPTELLITRNCSNCFCRQNYLNDITCAELERYFFS